MSPRRFLPLLLFLAAGCLSPAQSTSSGPAITNSDVRDAVVRSEARTADRLDGTDAALKKIDSQNAIQTNQNAQVGLAVGKLGDEVSAVKLAVSSVVDLKLDAKMSAVATAQADLKASLSVNASATAKLEAKLDSLAAAQAGLSNSVSSMKQTLTAGHDVVQDQFTPEMVEALKNANRTTSWAAAIFCGLILLVAVFAILVMRGSRLRADARSKELLGHLTRSLLK